MSNLQYKNERGFTLIELILALAIFSILSLSISTLLNYTIKINNKLIEKSMRLEDARIAIDFIQTFIKSTDGYKIVSSAELHVGDKTKMNVFKFDKVRKQITFGNNKLAENVKSFNVKVDNEIINIKIVMEAEENCDSLEIIRAISVKYKQIF